MQKKPELIVILGTGGTIAGTASVAGDNVGYTAGSLSVAQLLAAVPALQGRALELEQVAQLDSKDMDHATWQRLAQRLAHHLARAEVRGVVITHGTDTLEETSYFLQRVLAPNKPVVLTAAMRPATALHADGPQNLLDAVTLAGTEGACGVLLAFGGEVLEGARVQKTHTYRLQAFKARDSGPLGVLEEGRYRALVAWPQPAPALGLARIAAPSETWPRVAVVMNHAGADGSLVRALLGMGLRGLVLAGTGNGTLSTDLEAACRDAQAQGVRILRTTRCEGGAVLETPGSLPGAGALSAVQARVELLLQLLA